MRRQQLQESLGVLTSEDWWAECVANINNGRAAAEAAAVEEEAILEQLWHHDLRDVVEMDHPSEAATALRRAVAQSQQQQPPTVRLPENFRLLVQVENVSNMAVNAEKRLAPDGAAQQHSSSSPSSSRCLKLAFSDGYNNDHSGPEAAAPSCFTAMEVSIIPDLTTNARAGVKVLIRGPMTIRHGICGWMAANAIVLGGQVEELLQYQQQALQRERQRVGHGVDPTVKALIWMTNHCGDPQDDETNNNELDESERASGDVDAGAARSSQPPPMHPAQHHHQPTPPPGHYVAAVPRTAGPAPVYPHNSNTTPPANNFMVIPSNEPVRGPHVPPGGANPIPRPALPLPPPNNNHHQQQQGASHPSPFSRTVHHQEFPVPQNISPVVHTFNGTARSASAAANPYQRSSFSSGPPRPVSSPPASRSTPTTVALLSQTSTDSSISNGSCSRSTDNPYQQQRHTSRPAAPLSTAASILAPPGSSSPAAPTAAPTTPIGFLQLRVLLQQALSDPSRHLPDIQDKTFTVSMNQVGIKLGFNIERKKNGGAKQYEYVMDAKFGGDNQEQMLITCRVTNTVLEPFFSLPPGEMRKLTKTDKCRSADLIRDGGKAVTSQMRNMGNYIVVPMVDGNTATTTRPTVVDGPLAILQVLRVA